MVLGLTTSFEETIILFRAQKQLMGTGMPEGPLRIDSRWQCERACAMAPARQAKLDLS
jgi:hypothetical protein